MNNRNFPYILLGRAIWYAHEVASRSHALRGNLDMSMDESFKEKWLDDTIRKDLEKYHKKFRSKESIESTEYKSYEGLIREALSKVF
jgi:hypothetical protein